MSVAYDFLTYTAGARDRWDNLADLFYGDPLRYRELIRANPEIGNTPFIPEGSAVRIPILDAAPESLAALPPWRS